VARIDDLTAAAGELERAFPRLLTPVLIVDLAAVENNVAAMIGKLGDPRRWRPHLKTVKQSVIVALLLEHGVSCFKVATLHELALLLETANGAGSAIDALVAYPLHGPALDGALRLAEDHRGHRVRLLADSPEHLDWIERRLLERGSGAEVVLDVDLGMGRTGSPPNAWREVGLDGERRAARITGLHGYDGHLRWERREEAHAGYDALCALAERAAAPERLDLITSGTHSYAHALAHERLQGGRWRAQVSPGTVLFSDLRSAPAAEDLGLRQAAFVLSRVVSRRADGVTLDAGSKAISPDGEPPSCAVVGYPELVPLRASEEHLPCRRPTGAAMPDLGETCWLIPSHVCTTVNLYREAIWIRGPEVVGAGPVEAAGRRCYTPGSGAHPE
jgi:D-serine deaminase-like pyridoxal phosphate-dependent protein